MFNIYIDHNFIFMGKNQIDTRQTLTYFSIFFREVFILLFTTSLFEAIFTTSLK